MNANLLFPEFLYGLFAISIPIIIHLFNLRKFKTIYFSNVHFLKEIKQDTKSKARVKHLIILLLRILAITCLVLAFCKPFIPAKDQNAGEETLVSIYIDNSFSMNSSGKYGRLIEQAKNIAGEIINQYPQNTKFYLTSNSNKDLSGRLINKEEVEQQILEIEETPIRKNLSSIFKAQYDIASDKNLDLYVISDFQKNITDVEKTALNEEKTNVYLIPLEKNVENNLYIDSCWLSSPIIELNQPISFNVKVSNFGDEDLINIPLSIKLNDKQKALGNFNIKANETIVTTLNFTVSNNGIHNGIVSIEDHPITYDNDYYFSLNIPDKYKVLVIGENDDNYSFNKLLKDEDNVELVYNNSTNIDYAELKNQDLIIINSIAHFTSGLQNEIKSFLNNSGSVFVIPHIEEKVTKDYTSFLEELNLCREGSIDTNKLEVTNVNFESEFFQNVFNEELLPKKGKLDLPTSQAKINFKNLSPLNEPLMTYSDNSPFLSEFKLKQGKLYLLFSSLNSEHSNFNNHALFVPVVYKMIIQSSINLPLAYTIGKDKIALISKTLISSSNSEQQLSLTPVLEPENTFIPEQYSVSNNIQILLNRNIEQAGNYSVKKAENLVTGIALNYNRAESNLEQSAPEEIRALFNGAAKIIAPNQGKVAAGLKELKTGKHLWPHFIIATLIFLMLEMVLIRIWR